MSTFLARTGSRILYIILIILIRSDFSLSVGSGFVQTYPFDYMELDRSATGDLNGFAWNPDGEHFAVGIGNDVYIYDLSLQVTGHLVGHTDGITSVDWNQDGSQLVSSGQDNTVRVWQTDPGSAQYETQIAILQESAPVTGVTWGTSYNWILIMRENRVIYSIDEKLVYSNVEVWNSNAGQIEVTLPEQLNSARPLWGVDSASLITSGWKSGANGYSIDRWDRITGEHIAGGEEDATSHFYGLVSDENRNWIVATSIAAIYIFSADSLDHITSLGILAPKMPGLTIHPTLQYLAIGDENGGIQIFDLTTQSTIYEFQGNTEWIDNLAWNNDGTKLASASSYDGVLRIWNTENLPDNSAIPTVTFFPSDTPKFNPTPVIPILTPTE